MTTINLTNIDLVTMNSKDLRNLARDCSIKNWWNMKKEDLLNALSAIKDSQKSKGKKAAKNLREDVVTIQALADKYNMNQKIARRLLRNAGTSRNGDRRWAWNKDDEALKDAIQILKAHASRKEVA